MTRKAGFTQLLSPAVPPRHCADHGEPERQGDLAALPPPRAQRASAVPVPGRPAGGSNAGPAWPLFARAQPPERTALR